MKNLCRIFLLFCLVLILTPAAQGAIFAKFDGIDGESKDPDHKAWINALSIQWGVEIPQDLTGFKNRMPSPEIQDFELELVYDKASPKLFQTAAIGKVIPRVEIELTRQIDDNKGDNRPVPYLKYELRNVQITSYSVSSSEDEIPIVSLSCNFEEVKVTYTEYDSKSGAKGNVDFSYNLLENKPQ
jgi:type VI secretion system secreted protein Hcp